MAHDKTKLSDPTYYLFCWLWPYLILMLLQKRVVRTEFDINIFITKSYYYTLPYDVLAT